MPTATTRHRRSRASVLLSLALILTMLVALPGSAIPGSQFDELNGKLDTTEVGQFDWNDFYANNAETDNRSGLGLALNFDTQFDVPTPGVTGPDDKYAGGVKHDTACPGLTTGSEQTKSDFTGMYIAHEKVANGDTMLYLAWHRVKQNNDTNSGHASFIFTQSEESCGNALAGRPASFTPVRSHGDMLVTYDFQGGASGVPIIGLSRWLTAGGDVPGSWLMPGGSSTETPATSAMCETSKNLPCWGKIINASATGHAGGSVNHRNTEGGPDAPDLHANVIRGVVEFGEAALNLSELDVFNPEEPCGVAFGSVHVGSRASGNSFDAQLKDLIRPLSIDLADCGGIKVKKVTVPPEPAPDEGEDDLRTPFDFTVDGDPNSAFSLKHDETEPLSDLVAGTYTIAEDDPTPGYDLTDITCTRNGSSVGTVDLAEREVDIPVNPGDDITCVFTNTKRGNIIIRKATEPAGQDDSFGFTVPEIGGESQGLSPAIFSLTEYRTTPTPAGPQQEFLNVRPGTYYIDEDDPGPRFALSSILCDGADSGAHETIDRRAKIVVGAGQTVTCTFTNDLQIASILISKVDESGAPLPGATFERVEDGEGDDPDTLFAADFADVPFEGIHCFDGLLLDQDYWFRETPPDGWRTADDEDFELTATDLRTCQERFGDADDAVEELTEPTDEEILDAIRDALAPDAEIENLPEPGRVLVSKTDDDENPIAGVVFQLHEATYDEEDDYLLGDAIAGATCTTDAIGVCREDGIAAPEDPGEEAPQEVQDAYQDTLAAWQDRPSFDNLEPGHYCVVEDDNPDPSYATNTDHHCFTIERGVEGGTTATVGPVVNPRLHKIAVIVCHEGTDTLSASAASMGDSPDVTILTPAAGVLYDAFCDESEGEGDAADGLGRSLEWFRHLGHGEVDLTVDVSSQEGSGHLD